MRAAAVLLLATACVEALPDDTPYVTDPRVLAVRLDPPEAAPGADVALTALYADATGPLATGDLSWTTCTARKPLAELGPVSRTCLDPDAGANVPLGDGLSVTGPLPADACSLFGPNPPPPADGEPGGRPVDPDATGGFYQPLLGFPGDGGDVVLASARIRCGLANVDQETYVAWNLGYHDNANPTVASLDVGETPIPVDGTGGPPTVAPGAEVALAVAWPACPTTPVCGDGVCSAGEDVSTCPEDCTTPVGCGGAETYVVFDPATRALTTRREAISVSWFGTDGAFDEPRGGRDGDDEATTVRGTWTAPDAPGEAWLAVVLRDERGGLAFSGFRVRVGD